MKRESQIVTRQEDYMRREVSTPLINAERFNSERPKIDADPFDQGQERLRGRNVRMMAPIKSRFEIPSPLKVIRGERPPPIDPNKALELKRTSRFLFGVSFLFPPVAPFTLPLSLLAYGGYRFFAGYNLKDSLIRMGAYSTIFFGLPLYSWISGAVAVPAGMTVAPLIAGCTMVGILGLGIVAGGYYLAKKFA